MRHQRVSLFEPKDIRVKPTYSFELFLIFIFIYPKVHLDPKSKKKVLMNDAKL